VIAKALKIRGWMSPVELKRLAALARICERIVEIGTFAGRSARALADNTTGTVLCLDPYQDWVGKPTCKHERALADEGGDAIYAEACRNLEDHIESGRVRIIRGAAPVAFKELGKGAADLVLVDGDHRYGSARADIITALHLLAPGGVLVVHDYGSHPEVTRAADELLRGRPHRITGRLFEVAR
jgi:predicted O-methyltransferase YrrM